MAQSEHPVVLRFPDFAGHIAALIAADVEFACICRDYAEIVSAIAREKRAVGEDSAALVQLIQLRTDLEGDIAEMLNAGSR